jgi:hypothetical protein
MKIGKQSSGGYREYKPTFKNSGDVTFKCNFLPDDETQGSSTTGLLKDYEDGELRNFETTASVGRERDHVASGRNYPVQRADRGIAA